MLDGLKYKDYGVHEKRCEYFSEGIKEWWLVYPVWKMMDCEMKKLNDCLHKDKLVILDFTNMKQGSFKARIGCEEWDEYRFFDFERERAVPMDE